MPQARGSMCLCQWAFAFGLQPPGPETNAVLMASEKKADKKAEKDAKAGKKGDARAEKRSEPKAANKDEGKAEQRGGKGAAADVRDEL